MNQELKQIEADWVNCQRCPLGGLAFRHCLWDTIPAGLCRVDILFVGEAPGSSEDNIGRPFIGKAGRLLRTTINTVDPEELTIGFTNLVACKPQDKRGASFRQPNSLEIETCFPRLNYTILAFKPIVIVALGRLPDEWLSSYPSNYPLRESCQEYFSIPHPSSIERQGGINNWRIYDPYVELFLDIFARTRELKDPTVARFKPVGRV